MNHETRFHGWPKAQTQPNGNPTEPTIPFIIDATAYTWNTTREKLLSTTQEHPTVHHRQAAQWLIRQLTTNSYSQIARTFNGRDQTTVIHACKAVNKRRENSPAYAAELDALATRITQHQRQLHTTTTAA